MLDIITNCFTGTYSAFVHFPTSCQALQDTLFGLIYTLVINLSDTSPGSMFVPKIIILTFYGDTCIL